MMGWHKWTNQCTDHIVQHLKCFYDHSKITWSKPVFKMLWYYCLLMTLPKSIVMPPEPVLIAFIAFCLWWHK